MGIKRLVTAILLAGGMSAATSALAQNDRFANVTIETVF